MASLTYLNDASVLHNLKERYYKNIIYVSLAKHSLILFSFSLSPHSHSVTPLPPPPHTYTPHPIPIPNPLLKKLNYLGFKTFPICQWHKQIPFRVSTHETPYLYPPNTPCTPPLCVPVRPPIENGEKRPVAAGESAQVWEGWGYVQLDIPERCQCALQFESTLRKQIDLCKSGPTSRAWPSLAQTLTNVCLLCLLI